MENPTREDSEGPNSSSNRGIKPSIIISKQREYLPLKLYSFNAQGLTTKFRFLEDFIHENDPDVVTITETWLTKDIPNEEFCPKNYLCFRKDRELTDYPSGTYSNPARGGVLVLVKSSLHPEPHKKGDVEAEIVWIKVHPLPKVEWLIGCCYRPEVAEEFMLTKICDSINNSVDTENVVLTGDFNFRNIEWKNLRLQEKWTMFLLMLYLIIH